ncbi:hypothetical protein Tco_0045024 [Tanacetum coccineum]
MGTLERLCGIRDRGSSLGSSHFRWCSSGPGELPELFFVGWTMAGAKKHSGSGCSRQSTPFVESMLTISLLPCQHDLITKYLQCLYSDTFKFSLEEGTLFEVNYPSGHANRNDSYVCRIEKNIWLSSAYENIVRFYGAEFDVSLAFEECETTLFRYVSTPPF